VGKSGEPEHKSGISLKCVKIEEKFPWRAYRNSPTLFRTVPLPTLQPLPQDWGFTTPPKTPIAIISGTGEATDFKFGRNILRVHPNKGP